MHLDYIDHEDLEVTPEYINSVLQSEDHVWDAFCTWYEDKGLPQGLQLVGMHMYPSLREYVKVSLKEAGLTEEEMHDEMIVRTALVMDSMIS